jgi:ribonuclease D
MSKILIVKEAAEKAIAAAFLAIRLNGYADYPRGNKLWDNLKPENVSEDAAQEALVQMLLKTREQNAQLNDAKVNSLFWCGWLLFVGFLLGAGGQLLDAFLNASA